jgi:ABC-type transport system involved in multi-copper enzyme maturation permease subunit
MHVAFSMIPIWLRPVGNLVFDAVALLAVLMILFTAMRRWTPRVAAIAHTTAKEAVSQPLFYVILAIGIAAIVFFPFIPYNTFGEDVKMVKAEGLTLIKLLAVILALWTASVSIADEIEGRTALTLLSKPIKRWQLILGKFLGILIPVALLFLLLGVLFLGSISYKVAYDARETANPEPTIQQCSDEMQQIVPGLVLSFLETLVLISISVAISTRLSMLPNLIICSSIYVLGHLVPLLVNSSIGREFEIVRFMSLLLSAVLPGLEHFSVEAAISTGQKVPMVYLGAASLYAMLYSTVAMLLALLLFEDRDLA